MNTGSRRFIPLLTAALTLGLALASGPIPALAGSTRIVDDNYPSPMACPGAGYNTITDAVNSFSPGQSGTIKVCDGAYVENILISGLGKITITGTSNAILAPAGSGVTLGATGIKQLTVKGLTIDGGGVSNSLLALLNTNGIVSGVTFKNLPGGAGVTDFVTAGKHSLKVTSSTFTSLGNGIEAGGGGGSLSLTASKNVFTGVTNGVDMQATPPQTMKASITGSTLQGTDTGVKLVEVGTAQVSKNTIDGFQTGILMGGASRSHVIDNQVSSAIYGVIFGSSSSAAAKANIISGNTFVATANNFAGVVLMGSATIAQSNAIKNNEITDPSNLYTGTVGIGLVGAPGMLDKTQITGNTATNMDTPYTHTGDTHTVLKKNTCSPALPCFQ